MKHAYFLALVTAVALSSSQEADACCVDHLSATNFQMDRDAALAQRDLPPRPIIKSRSIELAQRDYEPPPPPKPIFTSKIKSPTGATPVVTSTPAPVTSAPVAPPPPTPSPLNLPPLTVVEETLQQLIPDAQFALTLAQSGQDPYSPQCYQAIIQVAQAELTKLRALPTTLTEPHMVTTFQIARDLVKLNPLHSGGLPPILVNGCGGLAQDVKLDIVTLMAKLVGQGALASMTGIVVP